MTEEFFRAKEVVELEDLSLWNRSYWVHPFYPKPTPVCWDPDALPDCVELAAHNVKNNRWYFYWFVGPAEKILENWWIRPYRLLRFMWGFCEPCETFYYHFEGITLERKEYHGDYRAYAHEDW